MKNKWKISATALVLLCGICLPAAAIEGVDQIYTKPLPNLSLVLDPQLMDDTYSFHVAAQIYDTLFKFDEFMSIQPNLVGSYQVTGNGQIITLNLRHNIRFHNGKMLNADDVLYTIQRFIKQAYDRYPELLNIKGAEEFINGRADSVSGLNKLSTWSLEITLNAPSPTFIMLLATPSTGIMPSGTNGNNKLPVGTGPFKVRSFEKDRELRLERNNEYFNKPPLLKEVVYKYATRKEAIEGFNKGIFQDLQWYNPRPEEITISYNVAKYPLPRTAVLIFNTKRAPFNNKNMRMAFSLALDRSKLMDKCFSDKMMAKGFVPYGVGGYDNNFPRDEFDLDKAKAVTRVAPGRLVPVNIKWIEHHPCSGRFDDIVKSDLVSAGFSPKVDYITYHEFRELTETTRDFDVIEVMVSIDYPEAASLLSYFRSNYKYNFSGYSSKEFDNILGKSLTTLDKHERYKMYEKAQRLLRDDKVLVPLYYDVESLIYQKYIAGIATPSVPCSSLTMKSIYFENKR